MKQSTTEFKTGRAVLMATTGLASAAALLSSAHQVMADGLYAGLSVGTASGESPMSVYGDDYSLSGSTKGVFVGAKFMDVGSATLGGELAFSGHIEGGGGITSSYDGAYDIDWLGDAKLRLGTDLGKSFGLETGKLTAYAFAGVTIGDAHAYYYAYNFSGTNFGIGIETDISKNMFVGLEAIQRNVNTYDNAGESKNRAVSLRVGFKF